MSHQHGTSTLTDAQLATLRGLPPSVRELRRRAYEKLNRGERVQGILGRAQRAATRQEQKAAALARSLHPCKCGCDGLTRKTFKRGHAARFYHLLRRFIRGEVRREDLPRAVRKHCITVDTAKAELGSRYAEYHYPRKGANGE